MTVVVVVIFRDVCSMYVRVDLFHVFVHSML